jgi:hypothetical protein
LYVDLGNYFVQLANQAGWCSIITDASARDSQETDRE